MSSIRRRPLLKVVGATGLTGLAGCNGDQNVNGNGTGNEGDGPTVTQQNQNETIKIGLVLPFSGPYGFYGEGLKEGIQFAFDRAEAEDGVLPNTQFKVSSSGSESTPEVGLESARTLVIEENVDILIGAVSSAVTNAIKGFVDGRDVIFVNAASASSFLTTGEDCIENFFRSHTHIGLMGPAGAAWSTNQFGPDVYIVRQDYSYGNVVEQNVKRGVEAAGGNVVQSVAKSLGAEEYGGVINEINNLEPDWISMFMSGSGGLNFYTQAAERGVETIISGGAPPDFVVQNLTPEQLETLPPIYSDVKNWLPGVDVPGSEEFINAWKSEKGEVPTTPIEQGYLPGLTTVEIIKEAGGAGATYDELVSAGRGLTFASPRGEITIRACNNQGNPPIYPSQLVGVSENNAEFEIQKQVDPTPLRKSCDELECSLPPE